MFNFIYTLFYDREIYVTGAISLLNLSLLAIAVAIAAQGMSVLLNRIQRKIGGAEIVDAGDRVNLTINFWMASLIALVGGFIGYIGGGTEASFLVLAIVPVMNFLGVAAIIYLRAFGKPLGGLPVYLFAFVAAVIFATFASAYVRDNYRKPRIVHTEICTSISSNMHEIADEETRKLISRIFEESCSVAIGRRIKLNRD